MTFFDTEHIFGGGNLTIACIAALLLVWWYTYLDGYFEKVNSRFIRVIFYYTYYIGFVLGIYLILGGVSTFDGWGDRIAEAHTAVNEHEGRGKGLFLLLNYGSPVVLILLGGGLFRMAKWARDDLKNSLEPRKKYPY